MVVVLWWEKSNFLSRSPKYLSNQRVQGVDILLEHSPNIYLLTSSSSDLVTAMEDPLLIFNELKNHIFLLILQL